MTIVTIRVMSASLLTALNSVLEGLVVGSSAMLGLKLPKKPHWDAGIRALRRTSVDVQSLANYWAVQRVRALSNSFKHNDGSVNEELASLVGIEAGNEIAYEDEDLDMLLSAADSFLTHLRMTVSGEGR